MGQIEELKKENKMLKKWYVQMIWTAVFLLITGAILFFGLLALVVGWLGGSLQVDCPLLTDRHCQITIDL